MPFKCPNCGYEDPVIWRHRQYAVYTDYTKLEELQDWDPDLAEKIQSSMDERVMGRQKILFYSDGLYNYGLREDGTVIRINKNDAEHPNSLKEPRHESPHKKPRAGSKPN